MDASKVFCVICAFLLVICLMLSITYVFILQKAYTDSEIWRERAETVLADFEATQSNSQAETDASDPEDAGDESLEADVLYQRLCVKEINGKIGVYSDEGYLIRIIDTDVKTLPMKDQVALSDGIYIHSWKELLGLIQDYE